MANLTRDTPYTSIIPVEPPLSWNHPCSWSSGIGGNAIAYGNSGPTFTTGTCAIYDPVDNSGRYTYISQSGLQRGYRFDCLNRVLEPFAYLFYLQGAAVVGQRLAFAPFIDGATKLGFLFQRRSSGTELFGLMIQR